MLFHPRKRIEAHLLDALDGLLFELTAWKGRRLTPKRLPTDGREHLQLGCGTSRLEGFVNSDFYSNKSADAGIDARFPLPFDDDTWRGIYAHHVVEHLSYEDGDLLFRECLRTLKPGGVFRMIVPDLEIFLRLYLAEDAATRQEIFRLYPPHAMESFALKTPLEMVDLVFRDNKYNRHLSAWDWETANTRLRDVGFSVVVKQQVNESIDPKLAGHDKPHWSQFSLYVEAVK